MPFVLALDIHTGQTSRHSVEADRDYHSIDFALRCVCSHDPLLDDSWTGLAFRSTMSTIS